MCWNVKCCSYSAQIQQLVGSWTQNDGLFKDSAIFVGYYLDILPKNSSIEKLYNN